MNKKSMVLLMLGLTACATGPKREIVYDYVISDSSTTKQPEWTDSEYILELNEKNDGFKYYVGENINLASQGSKSLCLNASEAQARKDLATTIESKVKSAYKEVETSSGSHEDTVVSSNADINIALNIDNIIKGAEKVKSYWEERSHKVAMGASKDYKSYTCYSLIRMKDKTYKDVIEAATSTMIDAIKSSNAPKQAVEDLKEKVATEAISTPLTISDDKKIF